MTEIPATTRWRAIERLQPGQWWLLHPDNDDAPIWAEVILRLSIRGHDGQNYEVVRGTCTDGDRAALTQFRGFQVQSLTAASARKAGITHESTDPEGTQT